MDQQILAPITAHLAEWDIPHVELAIYGTSDVRYIAHALDELCTRELQCAPLQTLFYQSRVSAVAGMRLRDGRKIVIKAHQPDWPFQRLQEVVRLQSCVERIEPLADQACIVRIAQERPQVRDLVLQAVS